MTPQQLKNSILQMAMQGKLVEQRPEEGTGEELYQQIQKEKQKLIKEGKIKKQKPLPEITEDEIPFEIPESWKWVRLGMAINVIGGVSYKKNAVTNSGIRILRGGNINNMKVTPKDDDVYLPEVYYDSEKQVIEGDIVIVASTGSKTVIGKAGYIDCKLPKTMIGAFLRICRPVESELSKYFRIIFDSAYYRKHIRNLAQGTNINNIKERYITELVCPLPPISEQKRIVARIEELMPYLNRYEKAYDRLENYNAKFPGDLKKSILQEAIQGKLVPQDPNDEPASVLLEKIAKEKQKLIKEGKIKKQKPLPPITEDEIPFEIPESWEWVRLGELMFDISDGAHQRPQYVTEGVPFISVKDVSSGKLIFNDCKYITQRDSDELNKRCNPEQGDILLTKVGTTGVPVLVDTDSQFSLFVSVALLKYDHLLLNGMYLINVINSPLVQSQAKENTRGVGNKNWVLRDIKNTLVVIPPLAEQHRIVAKLEELLPYVDRCRITP